MTENRELPILFNTEMVRAILSGSKTVTRRLIKWNKIEDVLTSPARMGNPDIEDKKFIMCLVDAPYQKGDILYVRETFAKPYSLVSGYAYKADVPDCDLEFHRWKPSIHMPKEAARIFLKVTDIRVERLQEITEDQAKKEGVICNDAVKVSSYVWWFQKLWNSTINKFELELYGWNENPWVWVIEFERCEKPE